MSKQGITGVKVEGTEEGLGDVGQMVGRVSKLVQAIAVKLQ